MSRELMSGVLREVTSSLNIRDDDVVFGIPFVSCDSGSSAAVCGFYCWKNCRHGTSVTPNSETFDPNKQKQFLFPFITIFHDFNRECLS